MIFIFTTTDISSHRPADVSDLVVEIMKHFHYIKCDYSVRQTLFSIVQQHGSTNQKDLLRYYKGFDVTAELLTYLRTVHVSNYSIEELRLLAEKPARLLVENSREWPLYQNIIGCYKRDRKFSNLFLLLERAKEKQNLLDLQAGGKSELVRVFEDNNSREYRNVAEHKFCFVFDRDTDDDTSFSSQSNSLFRFLCNNDSTTMTNSLVYCLKQGKYVWHMWYRREIENYFPKSQFTALGYELVGVPDSHYQKAETSYKKTNGRPFQKNDTSRLAEGMSREKYDNGLQTFTINGIEVNEMQLFLLKLVKII